MSILSSAAKMEFLDWQVAYHQEEIDLPTNWLPATVPGAVQLDVMKGERYEQPWWYGDNHLQFDWMETFFFTYRATFNKPLLKDKERLFFFSKGIDYHFKIYLNNKEIWVQEGMFTYVDLDLTGYLKEENELKIVLMPIPSIGVAFERYKETYRQNARESAKPPVSYGWDWHPRLVTRGIWDDTGLIVRDHAYLLDVYLHYTLYETLRSAQLSVELKGNQLAGKIYRWIMRDPSGAVVAEKLHGFSSDTDIIHHSLSDIELWCPNGYGNPYLYRSEIFLLDENSVELEHHISKVGFREVRLIMNEGAFEQGAFPVTRPVAPASLEVNKKRIFSKGTNWVHPELFVGLISPELYRTQITLAKEANFNILRVWGGGITNKEEFFDICDELGILVWQEFPLACNNYPDAPNYLAVLEQEARSIVKRVRKHACLAIWSGGNELFNSWSGMTDQSLALRLLNAVCYELDRDTPFIYTSPVYGIGHGHYIFYDKNSGEDLFQWMSRSRNTAYVEFGIPSASNIEVLKKIIPEDALFPPRLNTAWESHHAFRAWQTDSWLDMPTLEKYFGTIKRLENLVSYSQILQCEGLKFIYEEARRQKPYCSMALNWCYQEPWPTGANNSLINWPNEIKPAYFHVANACRPVLASCRFPKFEWHAGEELTCELFMLNDSYMELEENRVEVTMKHDGEEVSLLSWECPANATFQNVTGPIALVIIPQMETDFFTIELKVEGKPQYNSSYLLLYSGNNIKRHFPSEAYFRGENDFLFSLSS